MTIYLCQVTLARECVLTGFSIYPSQEMFEKIVEMAIHSGLDKIGLDEDEEEKEEKEHEDDDEKKSRHCRVTDFKKPTYSARCANIGILSIFIKMCHLHIILLTYKITFRKADGSSNTSASALSRLTEDNLDNWDDFESTCVSAEESFSGAKYGRAETKLGKNFKKKKRFRNLEGLLSIQGELITEAENYDPTVQPCQSLSPEALGLSPEITSDLMILISAPRWHLLSWVLEWPELQRTCAKLLANPSIRIPSEELKFLNIDYTQFDEWSSDEEVTIYTGIEKGYEQWLEVEEEKEEEISEHGISEDEEVTFNTKHTIEKNEYDDLNEYIAEHDYLEKDAMMEITDEITDEAIDNKTPFVNENLDSSPEKDEKQENPDVEPEKEKMVEPEPEKPEKLTRSSKRRAGAGPAEPEDAMEVRSFLCT